MMIRIIAFFESPSNRMGFIDILGAIPPIATAFLTANPKDIVIAAIIGRVCGGLIKILQPDNTAAIATTAANQAVANTKP